LDIPPELKDELKLLAHKKNISMAYLTCRALTRYVREQRLKAIVEEQ